MCAETERGFVMTEFIFLIIGLLLGTFSGITVVCCFLINRHYKK